MPLTAPAVSDIGVGVERVGRRVVHLRVVGRVAGLCGAVARLSEMLLVRARVDLHESASRSATARRKAWPPRAGAY
jgi:hypothetical protein